MAGLNLTRQANATQAEIERCRALGNRTGQIVVELLTFLPARSKRFSASTVGHSTILVPWLR
ncbi:MAG: hypothetical protein R2932_23105 [Caldilineaceae bacterium]